MMHDDSLTNGHEHGLDLDGEPYHDKAPDHKPHEDDAHDLNNHDDENDDDSSFKNITPRLKMNFLIL